MEASVFFGHTTKWWKKYNIYHRSTALFVSKPSSDYIKSPQGTRKTQTSTMPLVLEWPVLHLNQF